MGKSSEEPAACCSDAEGCVSEDQPDDAFVDTRMTSNRPVGGPMAHRTKRPRWSRGRKHHQGRGRERGRAPRRGRTAKARSRSRDRARSRPRPRSRSRARSMASARASRWRGRGQEMGRGRDQRRRARGRGRQRPWEREGGTYTGHNRCPIEDSPPCDSDECDAPRGIGEKGKAKRLKTQVDGDFAHITVESTRTLRAFRDDARAGAVAGGGRPRCQVRVLLAAALVLALLPSRNNHSWYASGTPANPCPNHRHHYTRNYSRWPL